MAAQLALPVLLLPNCAWHRVGQTKCLYVHDLQRRAQEGGAYAFTLNGFEDSVELAPGDKLLRVAIASDRWTSRYVAPKPLPAEFYRLSREEKIEYAKDHGVHSIGWMNASGRRPVDKIAFLEKELPLSIRSIDYGEHGWGGRNLLLHVTDTGIVHMQVISGKDTLHVPMVVSPDSVIVRPVCDVKDKTVRGLYLNPVGWVGIFFESLWWRISR
jgi:hypothetical protein